MVWTPLKGTGDSQCSLHDLAVCEAIKNLGDHLDLVVPGCKDVNGKAGETRGLIGDVCSMLGYLE